MGVLPKTALNPLLSNNKTSTFNLSLIIYQVSKDAVIEEETDEEEYDATEETAMLPDKGAKVVITNDAPRRKSAEKRKSGGKICSKFYIL